MVRQSPEDKKPSAPLLSSQRNPLQGIRTVSSDVRTYNMPNSHRFTWALPQFLLKFLHILPNTPWCRVGNSWFLCVLRHKYCSLISLCDWPSAIYCYSTPENELLGVPRTSSRESSCRKSLWASRIEGWAKLSRLQRSS